MNRYPLYAVSLALLALTVIGPQKALADDYYRTYTYTRTVGLPVVYSSTSVPELRVIEESFPANSRLTIERIVEKPAVAEKVVEKPVVVKKVIEKPTVIEVYGEDRLPDLDVFQLLRFGLF